MDDKQTKVLSFVGGLVFFAIVAGVVISKDEGIRNEIQEQAKSLLKTSKKALQQLQFVVSKVGKLTGESKNAIVNNNIVDESGKPVNDGYDALWERAEQQNVIVAQ
jgi:hypothetical protein